MVAPFTYIAISPRHVSEPELWQFNNGGFFFCILLVALYLAIGVLWFIFGKVMPSRYVKEVCAAVEARIHI